VRIKVWGARGSVPTPGPATNRYGGNTSCVQVTLSDGRLLVLDAGSGVRNLGLRLAGRARRIDILLTHLHLDHIQGLMFFAPLFMPEAEIVIWARLLLSTAGRRFYADRGSGPGGYFGEMASCCAPGRGKRPPPP
jgi:phosphoribosyl 1,2-cyclic phosphodiesterase